MGFRKERIKEGESKIKQLNNYNYERKFEFGRNT